MTTTGLNEYMNRMQHRLVTAEKTKKKLVGVIGYMNRISGACIQISSSRSPIKYAFIKPFSKVVVLRNA